MHSAQRVRASTSREVRQPRTARNIRKTVWLMSGPSVAHTTPASNRRVGGLSADGLVTACSGHKGNILSGSAINFKALCKVVGCKKVCRWGLNGTQPTHCRDHGSLEDGLVCTVGNHRSKRRCSRPPHGAVRGPSIDVKSECLF
ncbi:unnamed protein product [Laminaria digitata]